MSDTQQSPIDDLRQQVYLLVRGGADPMDAAATVNVSPQRLKEWLRIPEYRTRIESAQAHARTLIDTGQRKARPGEWQRRHGAPIEVSMPGSPMRCTAHTAGEKRPCKNWAIVGGNVCRTHGGAAPQARASAARRLQVANVGALMSRFGHAAEADPLDALLTELQRSAVMVEVYGAMVMELPVDALETDDQLLLHRLAEERDRKARMAKMAIDAGVSERMVRVQEAQAVLLAQVISAVLDDEELGLDTEHRQLARRIAARHLRALPA